VAKWYRSIGRSIGTRPGLGTEGIRAISPALRKRIRGNSEGTASRPHHAGRRGRITVRYTGLRPTSYKDQSRAREGPYRKVHNSRTTPPERATRLCDRGLIWQAQIFNCEPYSADLRIRRCFQCHQFGHIGRFCKNKARCGHCAGAAH
jgi:hypothetical protein